MGWYPSVVADLDDTFHISYVDAINNDLMYVNTTDLVPELVDDGLRLTGQTSNNLPIPEYQFVGDDSSIVLTPIGPVIVYQNATSHELLAAFKADGVWDFNVVAGTKIPSRVVMVSTPMPRPAAEKWQCPRGSSISRALTPGSRSSARRLACSSRRS